MLFSTNKTVRSFFCISGNSGLVGRKLESDIALSDNTVESKHA